MSDHGDLITAFAARRNRQNLVQQVTDDLRELIRSGILPCGQKIPAEGDLARMLGVGRSTLREAKHVLLAEGLLCKRRGIGTFVSRQPRALLDSGLEELDSTTDLIRKMGYEPGVLAYTYSIVQAPHQVAEQLGCEDGEPVVAVSRTRTADGTPIIWIREFLPIEVAGDLSLLKQFDGGSMYSFMENCLGVRLSAATAEVTAIAASVDIASKLRVPTGSPLILLKQLHFDDQHEPVLFSENYHNPAYVAFRVVRRRK